jgi:hypothetical protein
MSKKLELVLRGTPEMILEVIRSAVEELDSRDLVGAYAFRRASDRPDYATWDRTYFATCAVEAYKRIDKQLRVDYLSNIPNKVELQLLPEERTLLRIPPPEKWSESFEPFLRYLLSKLQQLGFVDFEEEKAPLGFRLRHMEKND